MDARNRNGVNDIPVEELKEPDRLRSLKLGL